MKKEEFDVDRGATEIQSIPHWKGVGSGLNID
jgi:hypothetical protein